MLREAVQRVCARARRQAGWNLIQRFAVTTVEYVLLGVADELSQGVEPVVDNLKAFLRKVLPLLKAVSGITPNKLDDQAVAFLEAWLNSDAQDIGAFAATYAPPQ
jgi:cobalamin biosynthesis protein CobT